MASDNFADKSIVFRKLIAKSENKICFDCNAKNPPGLPSPMRFSSALIAPQFIGASASASVSSVGDSLSELMRPEQSSRLGFTSFLAKVLAISSADLFGRHDSGDSLDPSDFINKISFQAQQDIYALKNIAGEAGKKLGSVASTLLLDLQDRLQ